MTVTIDLDRAQKVAESIAREVGHLTTVSFRRSHEIKRKASEVDLVTEVDLAAEELITRRLGQSFPDHGLVAEEGSEAEPSGGVDALWIVDPLDGTTNYAHGHPFYCVSLALEVAGELVVGVIHAPVLGLTWSAQRRGGATRNGRPCEVSSAERLVDGLCASGFPYDRHSSEDNNTREWAAIVRRARGVRRCGSAAIDLALIADGTYSGYWEKRLNPWDMAAGVLLVEEAGGKVSSLSGAPVPPWPATLVASNGRVHEELVEALREG